MFLPVLDNDVHCPCDSLGVAHQPVYDNRIMYLFVRKVQFVAIGHEVFVSFRILHREKLGWSDWIWPVYHFFAHQPNQVRRSRVVLLFQHPLSDK